MYKFKIYRNPNTPSIGGTYSDATRYEIDSYSIERTLNPIWSELAFEWNKGERAFYRKSIKGSLVLTGDDFNWVNDIRIDSNSSNLYRILIISEKIDNIWTEVWRGFFSIITGEWDIDNCSVRFSDLLVWDEYNIILENIEREKNLIDIPPFYVHYKTNEYDYDVKIVTSTELIGQSHLCTHLADSMKPQDDEIDGGNEYVLYKKSIVWVGTQTSGISPPLEYHAWSVTLEYRRDYINQVNDPGADWEKDPITPIGGTTDMYHWVRNYMGVSSPSFTKSLTGFSPGISGCTMWNISYLMDEPIAAEIINDRARSFEWAIRILIDDLPSDGSAYTFSSDFMTALTNPITELTNQMNWLYLFQISDIKETSDPATKAMYSFENIEGWLKILNLFWYISDNKFIIEHEKFFDQGLSYDENTVDINILSDENWIKQAKATSKFSYSNQSLPRIEEFSMAYPGGDDFHGVPIIYHGNMANWSEGASRSYSASNLSTDISRVTIEENIGVDGFVLVATEILDGGWHVIRDIGALTGTEIWNAPLSIANIQDKYWRWARPINAGIMNNAYTEFDSVENNFAQEEFTINYCDELDPYKLVKTEYGEGRIETASLTLKDKQLTLSLSYQ